jgi:hypothetical protein
MVVGLGRVVGSTGDFVVLWSPGSSAAASAAQQIGEAFRVVCLLALLSPGETLAALRAVAEALTADRVVAEALEAGRQTAEALEGDRTVAAALLTTIQREC